MYPCEHVLLPFRWGHGGLRPGQPDRPEQDPAPSGPSVGPLKSNWQRKGAEETQWVRDTEHTKCDLSSVLCPVNFINQSKYLLS